MSNRGTTNLLKPEEMSGTMMAIGLLVLGSFSIFVTGGADRAMGQTAVVAAGQATGPVVLSGAVVDPDGAEIPGATLKLVSTSGKVYTVQSGSDGTYRFRGVPVGVYTLTVTMPGFGTYVKPALKIGETAMALSPKLAIADAQTVVNVTTDENHVSVDPDSNVSATVLKGKDLDALSDDPDELSSELSALAGPSSGPNGGQIYIDGFTGGQLPPKSSIREIRINSNPFSAQYDQPGFGRIEVFTKPGTDKIRFFGQIQGNERQFNTGSPFVNNSTQPDYHVIFALGQLSGPLAKWASYTVGGNYRNTQDNNIIDPSAIYATSQTSGVVCLPGQSGCAVYTGYQSAQLAPQTRWQIRPRFDLALGPKNTLTVSYQYESNDIHDQGIGGSSLASVGYSTSGHENTIQLSDSQILSNKVVNETRFQYQRETANTIPYSTAAKISVQGAFTGGGSGGGISEDVQTRIEVQNYTSVALAKNFIRLGGRLRYNSDNNTTNSGTTGVFTYTSICNYVATAAACPNQTVPVASNFSSFVITQIAKPTVETSITDLGLYAESDWKVKPNWTLSYGIRYETQNSIHDHNDWAPRISTAYGLGKKTVIRAGFGVFYDRFQNGSELTTAINNGTNEQKFTLSSPSSTVGISSCGPANGQGSNTSSPYGCQISASRLTINTVSSNLHAPYRMQENLGVDQQLSSKLTMSVNYQQIRGVHQFNSDVPNYDAGSTSNLDYEYQSEGLFNQSQLITNFNLRNFHGASLGAFYSLNFAKSDASGFGSFATTPNDLRADYGRASFDRRNFFVLYGSYTLPHLISVAPLVFASSGNPYNITSGLSQYGDNVYNQRAVLVPAGTTALANGYVKTIPGCGTFATPGTLGATGTVPINYCTGPSQVSVSLRVAETIGFGPSTTKVAGQDGPGGQRGQGMPGGPPPGGGGGGHGGGGGGGGMMGMGGGGASSGKKYNLSLGVQAQNLFNDANLSTPVGTLSSPSFGTSLGVSGQPFAFGSALRKFTFQASLNF